MAGVYSDIPGNRFALDRDGTVANVRNVSTASAWSDVTAGLGNAMDTLSDDYLDLGTIGEDQTWELALGFPEARTINGMFIQDYCSTSVTGDTSTTFFYSTDTTDGTNGTWTTFTGAGRRFSNGTTRPYYRSSIGTFGPLTGVTGLRIRRTPNTYNAYTAQVYCLHVYGSRPTASVDRLEFWDQTLDQYIGHAFMDFGDITQGSTHTKQFRVKNLSNSLTANSISITVNDPDGIYSSNLQVSTDNTNYLNSVNIGNLAPGATSSALYLRRIVPGAETPDQRSAGLLADAVSWS